MRHLLRTQEPLRGSTSRADDRTDEEGTNPANRMCECFSELNTLRLTRGMLACS